MTARRNLIVLLGLGLTMGFCEAFAPMKHATRTVDTNNVMTGATHSKLCESARHAGSRAQTPSSLNLFGNMFGSDVDSTRETKVLATIDGLGTTEQKYDSLAEYIQQWSKFFEDDPKGMGLVTKVNVLPLDSTTKGETTDDGVEKVSGVKIVFKKSKTGGSYKSSKEEKAVEEGGTTVKKKKVIREGGVAILVEQLTNGNVQVRARRCETDEETTIKEMSEEAIVNDLKKAVGVWKKQQ